jgi:cytoskeleton protein RodZ
LTTVCRANLHNGNVGVIGDTLSEARTRRAVDLEEVHAATGIRPRYLEAIEQEDWDALPEEFYARSFIRKYARYLDVNPDPLVEEYRRLHGRGPRGGEAPTTPFARTSSRRADALRRRRKRQSIYAWVGAVALLAAIVAGVVLLSSGGGEGGGRKQGKNAAGHPGGKAGAKGTGAGHKGAGGAGNAGAGKAGKRTAQRVKLKLEPTAEVWACVINGAGKRLVNGRTLAPGETVGPFHSRSYAAAFGNGSVRILVDGMLAKTGSTPNPMGIAVDPQGKVHELPEGERPSCE